MFNFITEVYLIMNKSELVAAVAEKCEMSKKDVDKVLAGILETVVETVAGDEKIQLVGFGTFELRSRNARKGRDPRTGEEIDIPASNIPAFKAGKSFKEAVNK